MTSPDSRRPFVIHVLQPDVGGVPTYVERLVRAQLRHGYRVTAVATARSAAATQLAATGAEVASIEFVRRPSPPRDLRALGSIVNVLRTQRPDLVHLHSSKAGLLGGIAARLVHTPSVYTPHAWAFSMRAPLPVRILFAAVEAFFGRFIHSEILTVSRHELAAAHRWRVLPPDRGRVVYTGVDLTPPEPERLVCDAVDGVPCDKPVVSWVGRLDAQKRPDLLPQIAAELRDVAGMVAMAYGLESSPLGASFVAAGGFVAPAHLDGPELIAGSDILVQTSAWESFPLVNLEAMASGIPIVAFAVGGVPEQIEDGVTGFLVAPGDLEGLVGRCRELAEDPVLRVEMGQAARTHCRALFSRDVMVEKIERQYAAASGRRHLDLSPQRFEPSNIIGRGPTGDESACPSHSGLPE